MLDIDEVQKRLQNHREFFNLKEEQEKQQLTKKLKDTVMEDINLDLKYDDDDVNTVLIKMIRKGTIKAKIDMNKNIVVFDEEESDIVELVKKIETQSKDIIHVIGKIKEADKNVILQKKAGIQEEDESVGELVEEEWMDQMM